MTERAFPTNFLWGVATSGHQTEGDNVDSDTWFLEQQTPSIFQEPSGKACNSWERWEDDVRLVADLGLNAYRYSVEWARIEPRQGEFSDEAIAHYTALTDRCVELGIQPVVTFSHFTSPHWFAMRGSWLDAGRSGRLCPILRSRDGGVRRSHRLRRDAQRAEPAPHAGVGEPPRRSWPTWSGRPSKQRARRQVSSATAPATSMLVEEFPAMQDGTHRRASSGEGGDQVVPRRPAGGAQPGDGRRSGGR